MYKTVQIKGRKYRINLERFSGFVGAVTLTLMTAAAFCFFFGMCWGGFLR